MGFGTPTGSVSFHMGLVPLQDRFRFIWVWYPYRIGFVSYGFGTPTGSVSFHMGFGTTTGSVRFIWVLVPLQDRFRFIWVLVPRQVKRNRSCSGTKTHMKRTDPVVVPKPI